MLAWFLLYDCCLLLGSSGQNQDTHVRATGPSKLLDGSSEFVLTYKDRDGDWMLVGDVPWGYGSFLDVVHGHFTILLH